MDIRPSPNNKAQPAKFKVEIANAELLTVSGTYGMNPEQAAAAALAIRPQYAIPMHYGKSVGSDQEAADFNAALKGKINIHI